MKNLTNILDVCTPLPADGAGAFCRAAFGSMLEGHAFGGGCCCLGAMVMTGWCRLKEGKPSTHGLNTEGFVDDVLQAIHNDEWRR